MPKAMEHIVVRALHSTQGNNVDVYSFFVFGSDITKIADISRVCREEGEMRGFQRKEIRSHVNAIVEFLDSGPVLFPNAIILALSNEIEFKQTRGPSPINFIDVAQAGTLSIPIYPEGKRIAWIVDGQQRSLALAKAKNNEIAIPVVGFVCPDIEIQREQFILVNKAKPLPTRLINELLPEVNMALPKDLAVRKLPSELCNLLNKDPNSPFYRLIRRESDSESTNAIVVDSALIEAFRRNLKSPLGALSQFKISNVTDTEGMYRTLITYWSAARDVFQNAWGKPPTESRLMHSAGIRALGALMDQIMLRADGFPNPEVEVHNSLQRLAPHCAWTEGTWPDLGWRWNEVQNTGQHIIRLSEFLIRLDRELSRRDR
ncbi:DGQHR domain-containing protein DpdB [Candidatus Methylomicrobium oryzae]|uniref:DGQHR domain-containing protein DpdB n=1 Tax=Candidatus Methylomicrobium oryzae TaxID=2802053 RepID=UPI0019210C7C|nr:DGQHR domain-containing protein DpdB [Methylomicrobium sp. RS1]MBL1265495.1 DGQHR domain-containing protein [Methylomicrobium sp. RS1]